LRRFDFIEGFFVADSENWMVGVWGFWSKGKIEGFMLTNKYLSKIDIY
jgi:hypothetical protein